MFDYHTHTNFSDDSTASPESMIERAIELKIKEYAITDHFDPDYPSEQYPFLLDFVNYHKMLIDIKKKYSEKIKIIKGIEMGIQPGKTMDKCNFEVDSFHYDFVIGSFHACSGMEIDSPEFYESESPLKTYLIFYENMYECLKSYKNYDVLGHFSIIDRYAPKIPDFKEYAELVSEILKMIISDGKGIELNTSSFRYNMMPTTLPRKEILEMYRDYGGRVLTMVSDAHKPEHISYGFKEMRNYLTSLGFDSITTFENRKPSQNKL